MNRRRLRDVLARSTCPCSPLGQRQVLRALLLLLLNDLTLTLREHQIVLIHNHRLFVSRLFSVARRPIVFLSLSLVDRLLLLRGAPPMLAHRVVVGGKRGRRWEHRCRRRCRRDARRTRRGRRRTGGGNRRHREAREVRRSNRRRRRRLKNESARRQ